MTRSAIAVCGLALAALAGMSACGEKKDPLTPDNPTADPLMLDAGGPSTDTPALPASGAPASSAPTSK